jgi:tetratricopeptide (TPR) repeat protein
LADLNKAVAAEPRNIEAILNRAAALRGLGDRDHAIADFDAVIKLRPDVASAYYERGNTYREKGDMTRAIADYSSSIRLKPDYIDAFNDRGLTYQFSKRFSKAFSDYATAIRLAPNDPDPYYNRAKLYRDLGQYDNAIADYNELIALTPRFPPAYNGRAYTNFHAGRFDAAVNDFRRSLAMTPGQAYPILWLHVANLRAQEDDNEELAANVKAIDNHAWPAPIASYFTRSLSAAGLIAEARHGNFTQRADWICDTDFFLGEDALAKRQKALARHYFLEASKTCRTASPSLTGAMVELRHR